MTCARSYAQFLNFLSNDEDLDCYLWPNILPKVSKITVIYPELVKINSWVNFDLPKVSKMSINFKLLKVSKITSLKISSQGEVRNIKFGQQVNLIQRVSLGTLPQEVVISQPHNHVTLTNLFVSIYRGDTVIKFWQ